VATGIERREMPKKLSYGELGKGAGRIKEDAKAQSPKEHH
jgi:hypothetical protein